MDIYKEIATVLGTALSSLDGRHRNSLWLREIITPDENGVKADLVDLIDMSVMPIIQGIQQRATLVDVACAIGRKLRLKFNYPNDTLAALSGGLKILEAFSEVDFLDTKRTLIHSKNRKRKKHPVYHIFVKDNDAYDVLLQQIAEKELEESPLKDHPADWEIGFHSETGQGLIRHGNLSALQKMNAKSNPVVFKVLNKLQRTGYRVNNDVFKVYVEALKWEDSSPFKFVKETNREARASMELEAKAIRDLANKNLTRVFYHRYNCDFRGRIYPGTAFLHEQSSDNAKGLLLYDHSVPFGENGAYFLAVHTAGCMGEDKIPLHKRVEFINEKMDEICGWAQDPLKNRGGTEADKPWSALAAAFEWEKFNKWVIEEGKEPSKFESSLPIFVDGSCNGLQHLTALALDHITAPLVNLTKTEDEQKPGDIYTFVADKCWGKLRELYKEIPEEVKLELPRLLEEIKDLKMRYEGEKKKKDRDVVYKEIVEWRKENRDFIDQSWVGFWLLSENIRRKVIKRNVMTLPYGVTRAGTRSQLFDDTKGLSEALTYKEKFWVNPMGDLVFDTCYEELVGPSSMLTLFRQLAERANAKNEFLSWTVPVTNFPVIQAYEEPKKQRVNVMFLNKRLQLTIQKYEDMKLSRRDQLTGASPNIIHSFDAAHLTMTTNACDFPVTTVHDSFGCHAGNMDRMFTIVRQQFVEFYKNHPLDELLKQLNAMDLKPKQGELDIYEVLLSDFAFC